MSKNAMLQQLQHSPTFHHRTDMAHIHICFLLLYLFWLSEGASIARCSWIPQPN